MKKAALVLGITIILLFTAIPLVNGESNKINIVTTLETFSYFAKEIGGDRVNVTYIVPEGEDIHSYSLKYSDIKKIQSADLIILASSEFFSIDAHIKEKVKNKEILDFNDYNATIYPLGDLKRNIHGYWLYPPNAINITLAITNKLENMDPAHSSYYHENFLKFKAHLENTLAQIKHMSEENGLNKENVLLTVPGAFYVVKYLGMSVEGTILEGPHQFISEDQLALVKKDIERGHINYIVDLIGLSMSRSGQIAIELSRETGVKIVYIDIFSTGNYTALLLKDTSALIGAKYVEVYGGSKSNCDFYLIIIAFILIISIALFYMVLIYRRELLK